VKCLMLLLNVGDADDNTTVEAVGDNEELMQVVATAATASPSPFVCGSMVRLLTVVAGCGTRGRDQVLKALDYVRLERDDVVRFVTLVDALADEAAGLFIKVGRCPPRRLHSLL
jgi:hypothetical protein